MRSLLFLFSVFAGVVLELYSLLGQLFCPSAAQLCVFSFLTTYHRDGLAMRPGLGRALARPDEPEGDEPRVSRLGSNSSISSTSSCSSTSWSRMHLTEYWPNTQSCERGGTCEERWLGGTDTPPKNRVAGCQHSFPVSRSTYQLLAQLTRRSRLVDRTPSPQGFSQSP